MLFGEHWHHSDVLEQTNSKNMAEGKAGEVPQTQYGSQAEDLHKGRSKGIQEFS